MAWALGSATMISRFFQTRLFTTAFILIVFCTLVYLAMFEVLFKFQEIVLVERTYNGKRVCFSDQSLLTGAINKHLKARNDRAKNRSLEVEEIPPDDFQRITDHPEKLYMYSAYFDPDIQSIKLIGGARNGKSSLKLFCQYYDHERRYLASQPGYIETVENIRTEIPYAASFVICPIHPTHCTIPTFVSVSNESPNLGIPENTFKIKYHAVNDPVIEFALCVQPAFDYEKPLIFLEWIEFYRLMGVHNFSLYNDTIGPTTSCLMESYAETGEVQIQEWTQVFENNVEVGVDGQAMQLNDCILRYRGVSKYIINVDYDEMIVPGNVSNFKEMFEQIAALPDLDATRVSAFAFRNSFFYINEVFNGSGVTTNAPDVVSPMSPTDEEAQFEESVLEKLVTSKFMREEYMFQPYRRTKFIAQPSLVRKGGVHYLIESKSGTSMTVVPPEIAYLHHYRLDGETKTITNLAEEGKILEKSADRFRKTLAATVARKLKQLAQKCDLDLHSLLA